MFDVGFSELLVIALVALVVLGPERLPKAARFAGLWVRRARSHWHSVKSELEDELADEDMRRSILRTRDELREAHAALREGSQQLRADVIDSHPHEMTALSETPQRAIDDKPSSLSASASAPAHSQSPKHSSSSAPIAERYPPASAADEQH